MSPPYRRAAFTVYRLGLSMTTPQPIEAPESANSPTPPITPTSTYTQAEAAITAAFTPQQQAEFEEDELFGDDNAEQLIKNTIAKLSSTTTKPIPRIIHHPSRVANWLNRGFRQAQQEDTQKRQPKNASKPSHGHPSSKVTFSDKTDSQQTKRKRWIKSQVYFESQMQQRHPTGWNRRIPFRFQDKGCKLDHHGIHTPRKRQKRSVDDNSAHRQLTTKTLAASAATAEDEAKATQLQKQGFKPVTVTKAPYCPKEKSIYMEPDYTPPEDDEDWTCLHKNLGNVIHKHKKELPPRDDVILYHETKHKEQFDRNIQWRNTPSELKSRITALIKRF